MSRIEFLTPISPETMMPAGIIGEKEGEVKIENITLKLSKIDEVLKRDIYSYSDLGGMDRKEHKISGIRQWVSKNCNVYSPIIYITNNNYVNLFVLDGRHTIAFLIESGYTEATFIIPTKQSTTIRNAFG